MVLVNLSAYRSVSLWHTLCGFHVLGYLEDQSRVCAVVRVLCLVALRLALRSSTASRVQWLHVVKALMSTMCVIHLIGSTQAPLMLHFLLFQHRC